MGLQEAFAPIEADNRARVEAQTWGHLAPVAGRLYPGTILFAESEYGDVVVIRADFTDLPDSPWFYDDMYDFIWSQETEPGGLYQFSGSYQKDENAAYEFDGAVEPMTPQLASVCQRSDTEEKTDG